MKTIQDSSNHPHLTRPRIGTCMPGGSFLEPDRDATHREALSKSVELPLLNSEGTVPGSPDPRREDAGHRTTPSSSHPHHLAPASTMDSHDGIQKLLAAEQEAQAIVSAARAEKTQRLRQAKAEADAEIAAYRTQREEKYQTILQSQSGDSTARAAKLENDAIAQIKTVKQQIESSKKTVSNMLAQKVTKA